MSLPQKEQLQALDFVFYGRPHIDVASRPWIVFSALDWTRFGAPFFGTEDIELGISGTLSGSLSRLEGTWTGVYGSTDGVLTGDLRRLTGELNGAVTVTGTVAGSLPRLIGQLNGAVTVTGTVAGSLPRLTGQFIGLMEATATLNGALPRLRGSLYGVHGEITGKKTFMIEIELS